MDTGAGVELECEQFIRRIHYILVPETVGSDVHYLRAFGTLHQAACVRDGFQLPNQVIGLLG